MGAGRGQARRAGAKQVQGPAIAETRRGFFERLIPGRKKPDPANRIAQSLNAAAEEPRDPEYLKREGLLIDRLIFGWGELGSDERAVTKMLYHGGAVPTDVSLNSLTAIIAADRDRHEHYHGKEEADERMSRQITALEKAQDVKIAPLFIEQQLEWLDERFQDSKTK